MKESVVEKKKNSKEKVLTVRAEVYSRVVGYYRPVTDWNEGKREEFKERNYLSRGSDELED
jgi:anaerobic ribonucleoside-triphosphate reductase